VEVSGVKARLFVNDTREPVLVGNGLKQGDGIGTLALWVGMETKRYFANLRLSEEAARAPPRRGQRARGL